jgi:hypothetical protein
MDVKLVYTIIALVAGSVGSVALAALLLLFSDKPLMRISTYLSYLAGGTLLVLPSGDDTQSLLCGCSLCVTNCISRY